MGVFDWLQAFLTKPANVTVSKKRSSRLKRNDPCPCHSGLKYKKCHMKTDQEQAEVERVNAQNTFSNKQFEPESYSNSALAHRGFSQIPEISKNLKKMQKDES